MLSSTTSATPSTPVPTTSTSTFTSTSTSSPSTSTSSPSQFPFPSYHSDYPPFFSLQPTLSTRHEQLKKWSLLIQAYCRFHKIFRLSLPAALTEPLFHNAKIRKGLSLQQAREVLEWMAGPDGGSRAEWIPAAGVQKTGCWVWWRRPEEWAEGLAGWVEETGQKNTVLTLYELIHGDMTASQEFHGMDQEVLQRSLNILVKRGKAQVFGHDDQLGVKFF